jgi:phosphopantothenoylcysteine decarboxylase/phosphopantothenate--cysteine ligase
MYEHPATQANLATLRARGATVLEPGIGALGSPGEWGIGRLPEPPALLAAIEAALAEKPGPARGAGGDLDGLRVLVTAGGTREPIDAVRFIGNRSSGRMGFALADEAARRGAAVTVVAANVVLPRKDAVRYLDVETAGQLAAVCDVEFDQCDVLLMAAAVADYRPASPRADKIKKTAAELSCGSTDDDVLPARPPAAGDDSSLDGSPGDRAGAPTCPRQLARKRLDAGDSGTTSPSRASLPTRRQRGHDLTADGAQHGSARAQGRKSRQPSSTQS